MKKCSFCAEEIQDEAIVCRYCNSDIPLPVQKNDEKTKENIEEKINPNKSMGIWVLAIGIIGAIILLSVVVENSKQKKIEEKIMNEVQTKIPTPTLKIIDFNDMSNIKIESLLQPQTDIKTEFNNNYFLDNIVSMFVKLATEADIVLNKTMGVDIKGLNQTVLTTNSNTLQIQILSDKQTGVVKKIGSMIITDEQDVNDNPEDFIRSALIISFFMKDFDKVAGKWYSDHFTGQKGKQEEKFSHDGKNYKVSYIKDQDDIEFFFLTIEIGN